MAGIGFVLKKLAAKDNLLGVLSAYTHAALASSGPWLFTVLALGGITLFFADMFDNAQLLNFRVVVVYNFAFSLVLSAPVFMVMTRYLADRIHIHNVTSTPSVMLGSLIVLYLIQMPIVAWFYLCYVELTMAMRIAALVNVFLITSVWSLGVFLTALKDYNAVTRSFGIGMLIAVIMAQLFKEHYGDAGMLNGFSMGLTYVVFSLVSRIFAEYSYRLGNPFEFFPWFRKYWELAVAGAAYNAAIWVDKWIMWFAPESILLPSKMRMYPDYDSAMFLAYLTIVPAMAVFIFSVETNFFERYQRYYEDILDHMPLKKIRQNHKAIVDSILTSARNFILVQGTFCFLAIVLAAKLFEWLNFSFLQIGMFRLGTLGSFFHVLMLFELIILAYFDNRKAAMWLQLFFLGSNIVLTLWSMDQGFNFYGYGYFLSAMLSFLLTSFVVFSHTRKLTYHSFITSNNALTGGIDVGEELYGTKRDKAK